MTSQAIQIEIDSRLGDHLRRQVSHHGPYHSINEYIEALIQRDMYTAEDDLEWLGDLLEPALRAGEDEFVAVSAEDVIKRNKIR